VADAIDGLTQMAPDSIDRTPPFGTLFPAELVEGMAPFNGRFVPILDSGPALAPSGPSSPERREG
jgi:hypothetical protein